MTVRPDAAGASTPPGGGPLTVRQVLAMPCMRQASLRAGAVGLDREISGVNIIEVPEVWRWLRGGELLFSAAYPWRDDPARLADLVASLDKAGVAALALKPGQYIDRLPGEMLTVADEAGFPVLELPPGLPYRDVIEPVYERLSARRVVLERPGGEHRFTRLGLDEQSIEKVTGALSSQLRRSVYVIDLLDDVFYVGSPEGDATRSSFEQLTPGHREIAQVLRDQHLRRNPTPVALPAGQGLATALIVGHESRGVMAVLDPDDTGAEWVEDELFHAAELVSFLLLKRIALLEGRRQAASLFFESLMADTLSNEEAAERAVTLGVRLTRRCTVLVSGAVGASPAADEERLRRDIRPILERALSGIPHFVAERPGDHRLVALAEFGDAGDEGTLEGAVEALQAAVSARRSGSAVLAAGAPRTGLEGVRRSKSEAMIAYVTAERIGRSGLIRFDELGVERLLSQIPLGPVAHDYVASVLDPIEDDPELLRTLEVYLRKGGNKVATAAAIPMHRSSLMYRLSKLSQLLDADLNDPEFCMELWLAIRLRRIIGLQEETAPPPGGPSS